MNALIFFVRLVAMFAEWLWEKTARLFLFLFLFLGACAHRGAPRETARLTAALHRGEAANDRAVQHATRIGTALERIDAKNGVILQWLDGQP